MVNIKFTANGSSASAKPSGKITSGMVGVGVNFVFDDAWVGLLKTAFFRCGDFIRKSHLPSNSCTVPFEVVRKHGKQLEIGVEGKDLDGNIVLPTVWATVGMVYEGANGNVPAAPNPGSGSEGDGGSVIIDETLSISGAAADAKAVGDKIGDISVALDAIIAIQEDLMGIITFYITGYRYKAIEGMTWAEWVNSEYNTGGYIIRNGEVGWWEDQDEDGQEDWCFIEGSPSEVIEAGVDYGVGW